MKDRNNFETGSILTPPERRIAWQKAFSGINTPQFMAADGLNIEAVRNLIKRQKRAKGFDFPMFSNETITYNVNLSGTARIFLGFALEKYSGVDALAFSLQINNELMIDSVLPVFFGSTYMDDEYYFFPRPLSGTDSINVIMQSVNNAVYKMIIYYI